MKIHLKTFGHIAEGIARIAYPPAGAIIDGAKAIHNDHGPDRSADILAEIDASLVAAGDLSGKSVLADPAVRALAQKYAEDGIALHFLIEAKKKAAALAPATAADLGLPAGSTGE